MYIFWVVKERRAWRNRWTFILCFKGMLRVCCYKVKFKCVYKTTSKFNDYQQERERLNRTNDSPSGFLHDTRKMYVLGDKKKDSTITTTSWDKTDKLIISSPLNHFPVSMMRNFVNKRHKTFNSILNFHLLFSIKTHF